MSADLDGRLGVQHRCPRALPGALMGVLLSATLGGAGVARGDALAWGRPAGAIALGLGRGVAPAGGWDIPP